MAHTYGPCFEWLRIAQETELPQLGPGPHLSASFQVKATDGGQPALSASVRLHVEWIPQPLSLSTPLAFEELHYHFSIMETDPVNHMVGVVSVQGHPGLLWFSISGEGLGAGAGGLQTYLRVPHGHSSRMGGGIYWDRLPKCSRPPK